MSDTICNDHAPKPHNEEICHATGEKRRNIVEKLKKLLEEVDDRPCLLREIQQSPRKNIFQELSGRQLAKKCSLKDELHYNDRDHYQMQIPARKQMTSRKNELPEDNFYKDCSCLRANGLQDQCPVLDCQGREECLAVNPGPCCKPALTRLCEMQQEKLQREEAARNMADYENSFQNINKEDCYQKDMQFVENPKTLECFCYYN